MANGPVTITVGKTKLNIAGFRKLRTSPAAKARIHRAAEGIAAAAGPGFAAVPPEKQSTNRYRETVQPTTPEAQEQDLRDLTLIRAIDGGRRA
ncbi:hypothetical protein GCM10027418_06630 [Mariniluteicoccus endophyticus]